MARTFAPASKTALTGNTDLELHLDFSNPDDPEDVVMADMKAKLRIRWDNGSRSMATVKVTDVLSGAPLTAFRAALAQLRDAAFDAAGIPDV